MTEVDPERDIFSILKRFEVRETNDQLRIMAEVLGKLKSTIAVQTERNAALIKRLDNIETKFDHMSEKVDDLSQKANQWRGAFLAIMGLGGIVGAALGYWDRFAKWVHP